jgi:hypothetical protein
LVIDQQQVKEMLSKTNSLNRKKLSEAGNESGAAGSRRRSILPWNNLKSNKDRSKSKERPSSAAAQTSESDRNKTNSKKSKHNREESKSSLDVSKSSNNSSNFDAFEQQQKEDGGNNCTLARVILPDKATTVVQTKEGGSIRAMVSRLLEKRGLRYTSFDVFATDGEKPLDLAADAQTLGCTEVRVEPRVLFRLELPSKKSIGVKAKPQKLVRDVLGPILHQYGWNLEAVEVRRDGVELVGIDLEATVASIDNSRLIVSSDDLTGFGMRSKRPHSCSVEDDRRSDASSTDMPGRRERNRVSTREQYSCLAMCCYIKYHCGFLANSLCHRRRKTCHASSNESSSEEKCKSKFQNIKSRQTGSH